MKVAAIYVAPVKSLRLSAVQRARVGRRGIEEDRRFFLVNERDRLVTARDYPSLLRVLADYDVASNRLRLTFPDGTVVEGEPADGGDVTARFFGKYDRRGVVMDGPFADALSSYAGVGERGGSLRLVRAVDLGQDGFPVSLVSTASVEKARSQPGGEAIQERHFRMNFYIDGARPHEEDQWIDGPTVRIGGATVSVKMRDERCVMTTLDPDTGERGPNTLRVITSYRTDQPKEANFGVYAVVLEPGDVAVGDDVVVGG